MKYSFLLVILSIACLTSCDVTRKINRSTYEIERNTDAVDRSTDAVYENLEQLEKIREAG